MDDPEAVVAKKDPEMPKSNEVKQDFENRF